MTIQYFKATRDTNRCNKNQKVWIRYAAANYFITWHKWRGSGRYVEGVIDNESPTIGQIKTIEVSDDFGLRVKGGWSSNIHNMKKND